MNGFNGLTTVNVELTSRCNKQCWMCGRRKIDKDYPEIAMEYGDMDFDLVAKISKQLPDNIVVQLHNNGEPLLFPRFKDAAKLFNRQIVNTVTNGKLLIEKADEVIDVLDTIAISVFENDCEQEEQYQIIKKFLKLKGNKKPYTVLRFNGDVDIKKYSSFKLVHANRILHASMGSFNYKKQEPTVPEIGICLDFLNHMAINYKGKVSICVRFDPKGIGVIGNAYEQTLEEIWNSPIRKKWLEEHKKGQRKNVPLCSYCHFWGVPTGRTRKTLNNKEKITDKEVIKKQKKGSIHGK